MAVWLHDPVQHVAGVGSLADDHFMIYYGRNNNINAVLGAGRDREMAVIELLMRQDRIPPLAKIKEGAWTIEELQALI